MIYENCSVHSLALEHLESLLLSKSLECFRLSVTCWGQKAQGLKLIHMLASVSDTVKALLVVYH